MEEEAKPLIIIKQEEPIESRKRKLDEESEPNSPIVITSHMNVLKECCVCGAIHPKYQMTLVPKQKRVLIKWSLVLGSEFLKNCIKKRRADHCICSIHWKKIMDGWEGPIPDGLEYANDEKSKAMMLLDSIDEVEAENYYWESMKNESNEETEEDDIPRHMRVLTRCCVCGEIHQKYQMTLAPKQKKILVKWALVFGPEFLETCTTKNINHYICSIHWKQLQDDWEGPLPEVLEKMKKENNGTFEVVMFLNDIDQEESNVEKVEKKLTCRYCGARCTGSNMTYVPTNEFQLMKWAKRLGQQFLENVKNHTNNKICWSHFKNRDEKQRNVNNLPMTDEMMMNEEVENDVFKKCRFCYEIRETEDMVLVPEDASHLRAWVKELGSVFFDNVAMSSTNYICWAHFNLPISEKPNYLDYLPGTEMMQIKVSDENEVEYEDDEFDPLQAILKIEPPEVFIKNEEETLPEISIIEEKKEDFRIDLEPQDNNSVEQQKYEKIKRCRYCEELNYMKNMTAVTKNPHLLSKWADHLGQKFLDNVSINSSNFICSSYFSQIPFYLKYFPRLKSTVLPIETPKSSQEIDKFEEVEYQDRDMLDNEEKPPVEKYTTIRHCRCCNKPNALKMMTPVTKDPVLLSKWASYLGEEFLENVNNNISNYICLSHFTRDASSEIGKIPIFLKT